MKLVNFIKQSNSLRIERASKDDSDFKRYSSIHNYEVNLPIEEIIEWQLYNGYNIIPPEKIGALTSGLIISDDVSFDEDGEIKDVEVCYWDSNYQVQDATEQILKYGYYEFTKAT